MPPHIHNANFLGAALLCRVARLTGDVKLQSSPDLRRRASRPRGSRPTDRGLYGDGDKQQWIDNFHTGYNLCALDAIGRDLETDEFRPQLARGFDFYRAHFFREDGAARYFHDRTYPIDIHCVAQSIITLVTLRDLHPGNMALATSVLRWAVDHMWDERGFFYYRVLRFGDHSNLVHEVVPGLDAARAFRLFSPKPPTSRRRRRHPNPWRSRDPERIAWFNLLRQRGDLTFCVTCSSRPLETKLSSSR